MIVATITFGEHRICHNGIVSYSMIIIYLATSILILVLFSITCVLNEDKNN